LNVLLANVANRHGLSVTVTDRDAEEAFGFEDTLGVMSQRPMSEVADVFLGGVKPVVDGQIILWASPKEAYRGLGMIVSMCHR
jgi:hypothetical protein